MTSLPDLGTAPTATKIAATTEDLPKRILVALDVSDHANRALTEALRLAGAADGTITGIHAYAARLHDRRFKQMEGGLPDRYRTEDGIEHQRAVHDSLITRGLGIISDSYHDTAAAACAAAGIAYGRLSPEGKNYRQIVEAAATGGFDLLALGAQGLGAVPGAGIGTVCERVARRVTTDLLVVRDPTRAIGEGPLVAAVDGSARGFGALKTALRLGRALGAPVHVVAAYDPYFHYVAFNRIAGVLSDEAGKVFRFKEQEKLHEEIIDDGLAMPRTFCAAPPAMSGSAPAPSCRRSTRWRRRPSAGPKRPRPSSTACPTWRGAWSAWRCSVSPRKAATRSSPAT